MVLRYKKKRFLSSRLKIVYISVKVHHKFEKNKRRGGFIWNLAQQNELAICCQ
jgi:hypothetical protein